MNSAFTIVAKNYFALALTLADSIKKIHPEIDFYILLADEAEDTKDFEGENHLLIQARDISIPSYYNLAFKYNVTEFCTAVKPFFFDYLFSKKGYDKIIYFDPDIYIYNSLNGIYDILNEFEAVITPLFTTGELVYSVYSPETGPLFAGIYNLGFIGLKNSKEGLKIVEWWKKRLAELCYADKFEALHVDQKWIDYLPALFNNIYISKNLGYNIAYWNIHERQFIKNLNEQYDVVNRISLDKKDSLTFVHFSGLNPLDIYNNKQCPSLNIENYPDWKPLIENYSQKVLDNKFEVFLKNNYSYGQFKNGGIISQFQRRLFRRIIDSKIKSFSDPFTVGVGSFFELLEANKLLLTNNATPDKLNERNFQGFDDKLNKLNIIMRIIKSTLGFEKYTLLIKFCQRYFRPENQTFLIKELNNRIKFKNENLNN